MERIYLDVPFIDKDQAKQIGARWDTSIKSWYARDICDAHKLIRWTKSADKTEVRCPQQFIQIAIDRGAILDSDRRMFIPSWFGCDGDHCGKAVVARLCYWLPKNHQGFREFSSDADAALYIAVNGGYLPINLYLDGERKSMEGLVGKHWYICNAGEAYFRHKSWDLC
ncbi:MAG: hypothetical protein FJ190_01920 [Gammaproteobacteria bacterium]|nr:hypothetical protein [Gammaproteobacteria bacterium]